jgi:hypothetical protein
MRELSLDPLPATYQVVTPIEPSCEIFVITQGGRMARWTSRPSRTLRLYPDTCTAAEDSLCQLCCAPHCQKRGATDLSMFNQTHLTVSVHEVKSLVYLTMVGRGL